MVDRGAVALLEVRLLGLRAMSRLTPKSGIFFCEDLVMKIFLLPFFLFC